MFKYVVLKTTHSTATIEATMVARYFLSSLFILSILYFMINENKKYGIVVVIMLNNMLKNAATGCLI